MRWLALPLLWVMAGCSNPASTPANMGCAAGQNITDAAACWVWADSVERAKPVNGAQSQRSLLTGTDGKTIITAAPGYP